MFAYEPATPDRCQPSSTTDQLRVSHDALRSASIDSRQWRPSIMLAQGTPLWVVSEVLGHASLAMTKDVYGHLVGEEKKEATEAITDVLFGDPVPRMDDQAGHHGA